MKRRNFLRGTVAIGSVALARPMLSLPTAGPTVNEASGVQRTPPFAKNGIMVPDEGWRMWPDTSATWEKDEIFLPEDVELQKLPTNPPTGGWDVLNNQLGTELTLPATVEQFHWGLTGFRPYHDEYKFETTDDEVKNGAYYGVSWWWREIEMPPSFQGKRILLHVRAARQRAEVYLNRRLVGYSILEELPFECDLTDVAKPGKNALHIRITNPGGRLDWVDGNRMTWGHVEFQKSHGFGGIDRAMMLSAHGEVRIADSWVLNGPQPKQITAHVTLENKSGNAAQGNLRFAVVDPTDRKVLATIDMPVELAAGQSASVFTPLNAPTAKVWDLDTPVLYKLETTWQPQTPSHDVETREVDFGFRWFVVEGLGKDAMFRFNGRRIRLYTSISWGYWALNGLFPIPELAEKEVRTAKSLNLNTLNFHRNLAKEDVLYIQDRVGLLRCLEPGGGSQAVAPANRAPANNTSQRYMQAKIQGMIRAFRSHPSVIHYILQNEGSLDPNNPNLDKVFEMMHKEDPSRSIVGSDGFVMRSPEAWTEAYSTEVHKSFRPATIDGGAGGWWVDHTGHFSDVWQDAYYKSPTDFYFYSPVKGEIVEWGEMKGAASSDNHALVLRQIEKHGGKSYDKVDHQELLDVYNKFLDTWNFRSAFPTAEQLFLSIGRRAYETWGQFMENVRMCEGNDMACISGWESTAMEDHSGLVDNFRDFKADPKAISDSLLPVRPLAKQRQLVVALGDKATFDIYLLNDSHKAIQDQLVFTASDPSGVNQHIAEFETPVFQQDHFTYLVKEGFTTEALKKEGKWRFRLRLKGHPTPAFERELLVVAPAPKRFRPIKVGIAALAPAIEEQLRMIPDLQIETFKPGQKYDVILASGGSLDAEKNLAVDAEGAYKPGPGPVKEYNLPNEVLEAVKQGTPLLACTPSEGQAIGVARQLAEAGAFQFHGVVGPSRASWMGSWYFVREHALYDGLPVNQAMSIHYQVKGGGSNGWIIEGDGVEIVAAYSRDHDRKIGAGTFTVKLNKTPIVMHQITDMQPVLHIRFLANSLAWLTRSREG
jgi:beta-galactosidase